MESANPEISQKKLSAIILAAGLSTRMGSENKLLLKYKQSSIIQTTITELSKASDISEIIVVLGHEAEIVEEHLDTENLIITINKHYQTGQTSSIQTGVKIADKKSDGYMICLADMPFIMTEDYDSVISFWNQIDQGSIVRPIVNQKPGHPVIFDSKYHSEILEETYEEGCRTVIKKNATHFRQYLSTNVNYLLDIDKPSDKTKLNP